jgi:hypothetical protein
MDILYLESEAIMQRGVTQYLESTRGHAVVAISDPDAAVVAMKREHFTQRKENFDVILIDPYRIIHNPTTQARHMPLLGSIMTTQAPVVVMTNILGHPSPERYVEEMFALAPEHYQALIDKNGDVEVIGRTIDQVVAEHSAEQTPEES